MVGEQEGLSIFTKGNMIAFEFMAMVIIKVPIIVRVIITTTNNFMSSELVYIKRVITFKENNLAIIFIDKNRGVIGKVVTVIIIKAS